MMERVLIAYFSHEGEAYVGGKISNLEIGNTKFVAQAMEKMTGADIFRIETEEPYPRDYMATVEIAKREQQSNARPRITGDVPNMEEYNEVLLGYPNWWGTCPMAVFTFLERYDFFGKMVFPFCTHEGSGLGRSEEDIKRICPGTKVEKGLAITGSRVRQSENDIREWLRQCGLLKE